MKCGLPGHLRMSPNEEAEMTCVPHHLPVRNECFHLPKTVPSVSKYYHKYIICCVNLLDKTFFSDSENVQFQCGLCLNDLEFSDCGEMVGGAE